MSDRIDLLNRENFIENVLKLVDQLSKIEKGCCFAIEGSWGIGKTFVIEEIEKQLRIVQSEKNGREQYFVFHYNCWQHDYYEEPAVAIISAMLASVQKESTIINEKVDGIIKSGWSLAKDKLEEITGIYLENKIGINLISIFKDADNIRNDNKSALYEFDKLFNFSQTIEKVREKLQEIAKERTIVLVVDELDRCIPQYAIKVLERLHHIFYGLKNIVVIMAVDRTQLEHSVEEMFGEKEDSIDIEKYLKKFIDFSMILDSGRVNNSLKEKYKEYFDKFSVKNGSNDEERINEMLSELLKFTDIRRQEKIFEKANIVHSVICDEKVDISVLAFEIMYEVLQLWKFNAMEFVVKINDMHDTDFERKIGFEKIEYLREMEKNAWSGYYHGFSDESKLKILLNNLYGKVFWYFSNIFNQDDIPYTMGSVQIRLDDAEDEKEEEIARKYCEFCEMIK